MDFPSSPGWLLPYVQQVYSEQADAFGCDSESFLPAACCAAGAVFSGGPCCAFSLRLMTRLITIREDGAIYFWSLQLKLKRRKRVFVCDSHLIRMLSAPVWFYLLFLNCFLSGMITEIVSLNIIYSCWILPVYGMQIWSVYVGQDNSSFAAKIRWSDELHMIPSCNLSCLNGMTNGKEFFRFSPC